jgi:hypothetical protein
MIHFSLTSGNRRVLASIPVLACLGLAFIGCGGSSSDGGSGGDDDSPPQGGEGALGGGGSGQGGGGQSGTSGETGGAGTDPGGGGTDPGGGGADPGGGGADPGGGAGGADAGGTGTGGTSGSGGEAGTSGMAGAAGMAGAGGTGSDSCVNVAGGGAEPWYDLTLVGTEFDADEGERMRIVVASQTPYRVGVADLPIVDGAFALSMPGVLNAGLYVGITLYVDRNENDTCEDSEHVWNWTTRSVIGHMRFDVTPDELCDSTLMTCRPNDDDPALSCFVGTGDVDLTEPLPCSP